MVWLGVRVVSRLERLGLWRFRCSLTPLAQRGLSTITSGGIGGPSGGAWLDEEESEGIPLGQSPGGDAWS